MTLYFKKNGKILFGVKTEKPVEQIVFSSMFSKKYTAFRYVLTVESITSFFLGILLALLGAS